MLERLDDTTLYAFAILTLLISYLLGWIADAIIGERGFGQIFNGIILAFGAGTTLYAVNAAYKQNWLSAAYLTRATWIMAPMLGATILLITVCIIRMFARK